MAIKILSHSPTVIEYSIQEIPEIVRFFIEKIKRDKTNVFGFKGELGAGKTTLIKELVRQLSVSDLVRSPTYSIQCDYSGLFDGAPILISHWDLYRITEGEALEMYGEYLSEKSNLSRVLLIEWAERLGAYCSYFIQVEISDLNDSSESFAGKSQEDIHERRIIQIKCPETDK